MKKFGFKKFAGKWAMPLVSILALLWVLLRVIPKPQRAAYPCMKVAIPFAASLIAYAAAFGSSLIFARQALRKLAGKRILPALILGIFAIGFSLSTLLLEKQELRAGEMSTEGVADFVDPLGPNMPIGEAKGILPGRVVWAHNPDATNEDCDPDTWGDGYFLDKNASQIIVDALLDTALLQVSGKSSPEEAWDAIFRYFNSTHDKGDVAYVDGEKIFIKVNAVHAWSTYGDLSIRNDEAYGKVDTSPQVILAVLRQLVHHAGVPQEAIYLADPLTQIMKHIHEKLSAEFPDVHYMSRNNGILRELMHVSNEDTLFYSDRGNIMQTDHHTFYDCIVEADYVLNIPAMKGHRWGGVTFFAKNHFGSNTADGSWRLHPGLHKAGSYDAPMRGEYKSYRVMVDLMTYEHLGGKTLIYIGDFLWGTSYEHDPPVKFQSEPFNNDWTSSIIVSLDPVAIASVGLDILQEEFQEEDLNSDPPRYTYARYPAVDDYLHQAASSEWWPDGIVYDPEKDGTPIGSQGVHEHWNNSTERKYTRNLGTGEGIELVYVNTRESIIDPTSIAETYGKVPDFSVSVSRDNSSLILLPGSDLGNDNRLRIFNASGQLVQDLRIGPAYADQAIRISLTETHAGFYVANLNSYSSRSFVIGQN